MTRPLKPGEKLLKCEVCEAETLVLAAAPLVTAKAACDKCGRTLIVVEARPTNVRGVGAGTQLDLGLKILMDLSYDVEDE